MTTYQCKKCGWTGEVNGRPRCMKCAQKRTAEWHKKNPEKSRAQALRYDKKFRTERREEYNAKRRRYRKTEITQKNWQKRMRWLMDGDVTRLDLIEIYERDQGCIYCGTKVIPRFTPTDPRGFDHIIARVNGGIHTKSNIVVCCRKCNELKQDKEIKNEITNNTRPVGNEGGLLWMPLCRISVQTNDRRCK